MSRLANYNSGPLGPLAGRRLTHSFAHEFDSTDFIGLDLQGRNITDNIAGVPILTGNLGYLADKVCFQPRMSTILYPIGRVVFRR